MSRTNGVGLLVALLVATALSGCSGVRPWQRLAGADHVIRADTPRDASLEQSADEALVADGSLPIDDDAKTARSGWTRWLPQFRRPKRIPLPRTDLKQQADDDTRLAGWDGPQADF